MARAESSRGVAIALAVVLAFAAAFAVSALASRGGGAGGPSGGPATAADVPAFESMDTLARSAVRVEVLNGAGREGLARAATARLREAGFDVVFFGNARKFDHARSVVIDRMGGPGAALAVARSMGIDSVTTRLDSTLLLDVSVILGRDWPPAEPTPEQGWVERARGWLGQDSAS